MTRDATTDSEQHAEFATLLRGWAEAIVANDPARIGAYATDGWVLVGSDQREIPLDRFLAVVGSGELTHSRMSFDVVTVRRAGDTASVFARGSNAGTWQGSPFTADEWVTDTFVRRDEGWLAVMTTLVPAAGGGSAGD